MDNYAWLLIIFLVIGLFGTFIPLLPGLWLMCISILAYGVFDGWHDYSISFFVVSLILAILGNLVDFGGSVLGAKKFGASSIGSIGTIVGGIVGSVLAKVPGAFLGGIFGTLFGELYHKKSVKSAMKASAGTMVGMAVSALAQFLIGLVLLVTTIIKLWG